MTKFRISPVIGIMIMIAITVLLAGAMAWVVFGMAGMAGTMTENTQEINGLVLSKQGMSISIVDETNRGQKELSTTDNALFNQVQQFKRYTFTITEKGRVLAIKGPI